MTQLSLLPTKAPTQAERLYELLQDRLPHRTDEILRVVYRPGQPLARVAARVHELKGKHGVRIDGWKDPQYPSLYYYQLRGREEKHA